MWTDYWKSILAAVTAVGSTVYAAVSDSTITDDEWGLIGVAVVGVFLVLFGPRNTNTTPG